MSRSHDRYLSPLRYPGGKAKLAGFIKLLLTRNNLVGGQYLEIFAGGASVGLSLLFGEYVSRIHLNDLDGAVYAFWHSVLNDCDALCRLISSRRVSLAEWERQRAVYEDAGQHSLLELGFATFFLNRTNRSGIIGSGGVIGGRAQAGKWKLNARFNKKDLIRRIEKIAKERDRIILYREDGEQLVRKRLASFPRRTFVYLDPPYYVKGGRRLYANGYSHQDHAALARAIGRSRRPWMVSYDDVKAIRALYQRFCCRRLSLDYTARTRSVGREIMFFSPNLVIPKVADPLAVGLSAAADSAKIELPS